MTTPAIAIKQHCNWCCGTQYASGRAGCNSPACSLYRFRVSPKTQVNVQPVPAEQMRPLDMPLIGMKQRAVRSKLAAIRLRCLDCVGSPSEVTKCEVKTCALWIYRLGRNPKKKGQGGNFPAKPGPQGMFGP